MYFLCLLSKIISQDLARKHLSFIFMNWLRSNLGLQLGCFSYEVVAEEHTSPETSADSRLIAS